MYIFIYVYIHIVFKILYFQSYIHHNGDLRPVFNGVLLSIKVQFQESEDKRTTLVVEEVCARKQLTQIKGASDRCLNFPMKTSKDGVLAGLNVMLLQYLLVHGKKDDA